ncbi:unnamed protein product [Ectocarpus sp. 4 AP-2014]
MFAAAKNLGQGADGMGDLLTRLRAREKARHGVQAKKDVDSSGLPIMTAAALRQARGCPVAIDDEGYETPELNDRLYLHFKGYRKIQNLEPYTSLKALWLGGNGISEIQGIGHLSQLRCLYLERNLISTIKGLEGLESLVQLDLSQNRIEAALGLSCLPSLHTLNLSKNSLGDAAAVSPLSECPSLTNLDVTGNRLAGPGVLDVLSSLKGLVSLSLSGNPILAETAHFRKTVITASPKLRYQEEKRNEDRRQMQVFRDWQAEMRQKKLAEIEARAAAGLGAPEPTPEEVLRDAERAAKAKADAEEDNRLIKENNTASHDSRRDVIESLAGAAASFAGAEGPLQEPPSTVGGGASSVSTATASETGDCNGGSDPNFSGTGRAGSRGGDDGGGDHKSDSSFDDEEEGKGGGGDDERQKDHDDDKDENKEDREERKVTETDGEAEEDEDEEEDEEDEEEIRRVRVAQSLAMYRSQLAAERRLEEANLHGAQEEKTPGVCVWSPPGSPSRHRDGGAVAGGFQRRLEEASAEVSAEAAASPQIVPATSRPRGNPAENTQQTQRHRQEQVPVPGATEGFGKCNPGGGVGGGWSGVRQWTVSKDRSLARLVRECEFDFDLVAARFSSAVASGDGAGEEVITAEECRVRFARFDREEEDNAEDDMGGGGEGYNHNLVPDLDATPAPGVIENAGLSFADLERKARNMKSRFLEPPKDLPSTRDGYDRLDGDDDAKDGDADDDGDDGRDLITNKKRTTTNIPRSSDDADGCAGKDYVICDGGARVGATKEPVLLVINDHDTANADGRRGNFESNRSDDGGSDGEDDEVLTRAQIKSMAKKTHQS